ISIQTKNRKESLKSLKMFLIVVLSCVALSQASIPLHIYRPQPYEFGYAVNDHFSDQYRQ
ncbi:hypothetical protein NPIL_86731, partial [Nephila pilipes]